MDFALDHAPGRFFYKNQSNNVIATAGALEAIPDFAYTIVVKSRPGSHRAAAMSFSERLAQLTSLRRED